MEKKSTRDLSRELLEQPNLDSYLQANQASFASESITELLNECFLARDCSKAALARKAGMSEVYLHQVFSGRRSPSRDRLICLCMGMELTMEETQAMLKQAGYAALYPKNRRDAIISYGILHGIGLHELNDRLFSENEKTLF